MPVTAFREVEEETGFQSILGRALTTVSYTVGGKNKTVEYFAARRTSGAFAPNKEVDKLDWLPVAAARSRMSYEFDRAVLNTFTLERPDLTGVLLVRHARAGHRESYAGHDIHRPLDAKGRKQAQALVGELLPFGPGPVHSAPVERCVATVSPLAELLGTVVSMEPLLAEEAYRDDPAAARHRLVELAAECSGVQGQVGGLLGSGFGPARGASSGSESPSPSEDGRYRTVVACSQGGVIPGVLKSLGGRSDVTIPRTTTPKGAFWFLSFDGRRLVQADPYPAPAI
jgi:hypothetical protein